MIARTDELERSAQDSEPLQRASDPRLWCYGALTASAATVVVVSLEAAVVLLLLTNGAIVAWSDVIDRRIPNIIPAALLLFSATALLLPGSAATPAAVLLGALLGGAPLALIHAISPSSMGFGDVKLATGLGAVLGLIDWSLVVPTLFLASVVGLSGWVVFRSWRRGIPYGLCLSVAAVAALATESWGTVA